MYTLVIGRAFPAEETGMMGIFEFEQATALKRYGMDTVYTFCDTRSVKGLRKFNYKEFTKDNVPVYGYHFPIGGLPQKIFNYLKAKRYKKMIRNIVENNGEPKYIHVHFPLLTLNNEIWEILKSFNVPIICTEHWSKIQIKTIEAFRIQFLKKIVNESQDFICVSNLLKKSVIELTGTDKDITVIPNMVNGNFYYDKEIQRNNNEFNFIAIGRMTQDKRMDLIVEAFARAFPHNNHIKLHLVGDGPLYNKIKEKIISLGMQNRAILHGFQPRNQTANLLRESDVFVSASVLETFGVPFIEAMACGKPVIGVVGGPMDHHIKNIDGILFEKDNLNELSESLIYIYNEFDKKEFEKIALYAQKEFGELSVCSKLMTMYKEVIR